MEGRLVGMVRMDIRMRGGVRNEKGEDCLVDRGKLMTRNGGREGLRGVRLVSDVV